jgi:ketosteroid isomerase-like protein
MSQAYVEIAERGIDAFNRRDVDLVAELTTGDIEWFTATDGAVEGKGFRGHDGVARLFEEYSDIWEEIRVVADEFRDLGDCVVMLGRMDGRGRASGVQVDAPFGDVFDFRDGKISRIRAYLDHGEALRAVGLSE